MRTRVCVTCSDALTSAPFSLPPSPHPPFIPTNHLLTLMVFSFCVYLSGFDQNHLCGFDFDIGTIHWSLMDISVMNKTEDNGSSPPTIHQEPVISNNGQKPVSPPLSVIDCWEGLSYADLLIGVGMSSEYICRIMSRGWYFTALSLSFGSCILSISSFHKFPELWRLRLA